MDETSMASSSSSECPEDETLSSMLNGGEQKLTVIGPGGIGRTKIINFNSTFEYNVQITENRDQRSRKGKRKADEFDSFSEEGRFVGGVAATAPAHAPPLIRFMKNENEFDFESRRSVFNEILDAIKDDGFKLIGIWGMPGIGKTTLVKRVAKYAQGEGLFNVVAMAVVSQSPSFTAIQDEIADAIGLKFRSKSIPGRANDLHQRLLAGKKILVILDDIWDSIGLNDIGIPLGSQHKGCKVILTSRLGGVCEKMRTGKNFKINPLSENEALGLFLLMSGVDDRSSEKKSLAEELSKECGGLPLCIVIVARELLNKEPNDWTDMLNRLRNSDLESKVCDAIELSYNKVEREEEKMFFLLCALFPEDYKIPVQVLFEYGIGLNLFHNVNNVDQALVRAHKLASSLKSSCLLLDAVSEEFVKMHDVVRDAALAIASQGKNVFLVRPVAQWREWPKKTAISLWSIKKLPDALECPQLQILMLNGCHPDLQLHDNFFAGMKNLIVLDMLGMEFGRLPPSFAGLENLQTLRFIVRKSGDISMIGKLQNLVSLNFYNSDIEVLPKEVGELSNLRLLDLSGCLCLRVITPGVIQNLSQLEVLLMRINPCVLVRVEDPDPENAILSEFIHLSFLIILEICITNASMLPDELLFEKLTKFKISIGDDYLNRNGMFCWYSQILKLSGISENELTKAGIKILMKKAQHLELKDISGISVALPSYLGGFRTLKELIVSHCKDVKYVFDMSKSEYEPETPLQLLHLIDLPLLKEIIRGKFPNLFVSKLELLMLQRLSSLVHLWQFPAESVALTNLSSMIIESCEELKYIFERSSAKSLLKLKEFVVRKSRSLQAIYLCKEEEQDDDIVFPLLSQLKLSLLDDLMSFDSKFSSESTLFSKTVIFLALKELAINNLEKLEKIWHIHSPVESFFQLKVLHLTQCSKLLFVFPHQATSALRNLEEICIENCDKLETLFQSYDVPLTVGDEMVLFPRLLTLKLVNLPKFTAILSTIMDQQRLTFFSKLKQLQLEGINRLSLTADQRHRIKGLEDLEELTINDNNDKTLPKVIATLPKLRKLQLGFIHEPIERSESLYRGKWFQSLTSLNFYRCRGTKSLLTPSAVSCLVQLEELFVNECEIIELIVGETSGEQNFDKVIEFSKLRTLRLENLPRLVSFYDGECALKFSCLDGISIERCSRLKTFTTMTRETHQPSHQNFVSEALFGEQVSFGRLSHLKLGQVELIEEIWHRDHRSTTVGELRLLQVEHCDRLMEIFPSNLLAGLQNLQVLSCASLEPVFEVKDHQLFLSNLRKLILYNLPKLKQLWGNENICESFGLPSLRDCRIDTCPALQYVFDASAANHLKNLRTLDVRNCSSIVEIVEEKPGTKIMFPLLKTISLVNLPCFKVNQSVEFPQAMYVSVDRCFNMEKCYYGVNVRQVQNIQLQGSMSFFESLVEWSKTGMWNADA